jgi:hypothetical protein
VLAFSFEPWFWSSATHDLDYVWGTCSLVAALYYVERRELGLAGLFCALGFGFRPSSLLWIFPILIRVVYIERNLQGVLRFTLWAAIPALVPTFMIASVIASQPEAWAFTGGQFHEVIKTTQYPIAAPLLAVYHLVELVGHVPALLLILAACYVYRDCLFKLFRNEPWVWTYVLIFVLLIAPFISLSEKPEYMLPALPGLFMILGRCLSASLWKALTAAFIFNAFISFGFGHAPVAGDLRIEMAGPSLRPGAMLWYAERAEAGNDLVSRTGAELSQPRQIIRADRATDNLDAFYVSSLLKRAPDTQARIFCPLVAAVVSYPKGKPPEITPSRRLIITRPGYYPTLICCNSTSALGLATMPSSRDDELKGAITRFCAAHQRENG